MHVEFDGLDRVQATLDGMGEQIQTLGKEEMAKELTEWQTKDMKRTYPNTKQEDDTTVSTEIWPRSRLSETRKPSQTKRVRVYAPPRSGGGGGPRQATSTRPILRSELFATLCTRMSELLNRVLKWQTKA
jgi:hypothetical protein